MRHLHVASGGAEIKDRPQLFLLLQDIRNNLITSVWFRNQNRLERSNATYFIFTEECKKYNVDIYFNDVKFDYNNAQDNLFGTIKSALNQYQKDLQSAQTKRTLRDNILEGKVWSIVAYGYKSDNGYLKIDDKEAEIVKQIYSWSLQGIGTDTIADRLNKKGVVSRAGARGARRAGGPLWLLLTRCSGSSPPEHLPYRSPYWTQPLLTRRHPRRSVVPSSVIPSSVVPSSVVPPSSYYTFLLHLPINPGPY